MRGFGIEAFGERLEEKLGEPAPEIVDDEIDACGRFCRVSGAMASSGSVRRMSASAPADARASTLRPEAIRCALREMTRDLNGEFTSDTGCALDEHGFALDHCAALLEGHPRGHARVGDGRGLNVVKAIGHGNGHGERTAASSAMGPQGSRVKTK